MSKTLIGLDVGEKRIGVAVADMAVKIAIPYETIEVDGGELKRLADIVVDQEPEVVVVGYPRNQSGEATAQTRFVEHFTNQIRPIVEPSEVVFQDESLTSVIAEERLKTIGKNYQKGDIDSTAASIILQDYLESH